MDHLICLYPMHLIYLFACILCIWYVYLHKIWDVFVFVQDLICFVFYSYRKGLFDMCICTGYGSTRHLCALERWWCRCDIFNVIFWRWWFGCDLLKRMFWVWCQNIVDVIAICCDINVITDLSCWCKCNVMRCDAAMMLLLSDADAMLMQC